MKLKEKREEEKAQGKGTLSSKGASRSKGASCSKGKGSSKGKVPVSKISEELEALQAELAKAESEVINGTLTDAVIDKLQVMHIYSANKFLIFTYCI